MAKKKITVSKPSYKISKSKRKSIGDKYFQLAKKATGDGKRFAYKKK